MKAAQIKCILFLIFSFSFFLSYSQRSIKSIKREIHEYIRIEDTYELEFVFEDLKKNQSQYSNPKSKDLYNFIMGEVCLNTKLNNKAYTYFEKIDKNNDMKELRSLHYFLGISYQHIGKFQKAKNQFELIRKKIEEGQNISIIQAGGNLLIDMNFINKKIQEATNGIDLSKKDLKIKIFPLPKSINTPYPEYTPIITPDKKTIIFTTRREHKLQENQMGEGGYGEDIFSSHKDAQDRWTKAEPISILNTGEDHEAAICISSDGRQLFIYKFEEEGNGDIFVSNKNPTSKKWDAAKRLPSPINSKYWEQSAALSVDGLELYFCSNRPHPNALGKLDIYKVSKESKTAPWGNLENLGATINTPEDEESPYIYIDNKTLYFSSKGHRSLGGFDIYKSVYDRYTSSWTEPENLGYPINTSQDDMHFSWSTDGRTVYFASKREDSQGEQDLYSMFYPYEDLKALIYEAEVSSEKEDNVFSNVQVYNISDDRIMYTFTTGEEGGNNFNIMLPPNNLYGIEVSTEDYLYESLSLDARNQFEYFEYLDQITLTPINTHYVKPLKNLFFDENNQLDKTLSSWELDKLVNFSRKNSRYKLEIFVHADATLPSKEAQKITDKKAQLIADQLIERGVKPDQLIVKGYGSQHPIASNKTELGRKKNNRIEYVLRESSFDSQTDDYLSLDRSESSKEKNLGEYAKQKYKEGEALQDISSSIKFYGNSSYLEKDSHKDIEKLMHIMDQNPNMRIQIDGYFSGYELEELNLSESKYRTSLIAQQLSARGIDKDRIIINGLGSKSILPNTDMSNINSYINIKVLDYKYNNKEIPIYTSKDEASSNLKYDLDYYQELLEEKNQLIKQLNKQIKDEPNPVLKNYQVAYLKRVEKELAVVKNIIKEIKAFYANEKQMITDKKAIEKIESKDDLKDKYETIAEDLYEISDIIVNTNQLYYSEVERGHKLENEVVGQEKALKSLLTQSIESIKENENKLEKVIGDKEKTRDLLEKIYKYLLQGIESSLDENENKSMTDLLEKLNTLDLSPSEEEKKINKGKNSFELGSQLEIENPINFESNSYRINKTMNLGLKEIISFLNQNPKLVISIVGHADNIGSKNVNLELSKKRAAEIRKYLINNNIDPDRLFSMGVGYTQPIVSNDTPENRARNRRIEFIINFIKE